jgi:hypothetical protein
MAWTPLLGAASAVPKWKCCGNHLNREGRRYERYDSRHRFGKADFQVHGVDGHGKAVIRKQLKRTELMRFFANLPACLIGMEACSSAHYWLGSSSSKVTRSS